MSYHYHGEPYTLDEKSRAPLPGRFIHLPDGVTHYDLAGPENGQPIILVHGFAVTYFIWDNTITTLAKAGFRVIRYDQYGFGFSDRPDIAYDMLLFDRQLFELAAALRVRQPFDLVGMSLGGSIAMTFTDRHPDLVRKLVLIDPFVGSARRSFGEKLILFPFIGQYIIDFFGNQMILKSLPEDLYQPERFPEYQEHHRPQMDYAGFKRAVHSTLRNNMMGDKRGFYQRVGRSNHPILLIWGRNDRTIPFKFNEDVRKAVPGIEFHAIDEAGHVPHYERPEVVNPLIINFIKK